MGLSASSVQLLGLTARKNNIQRQLTTLSMSKMDLARDMQKVTKEYQKSLSAKTLKLSPNGGVTTIDMSYANLMRPGSLNGNQPYIVTDNHGKVVIDSSYLEYAKMISEDGKPGDWESVRTDVISSLTGIDPKKIDNSQGLENAVNDNYQALQAIKAKEPSSSHLEKCSTAELLSHVSTELAEKFASGEEFDAPFASAYLSSMGSLSKYFGTSADKYREAWKAAVDGFKSDGNENKYTIQGLVDLIAGGYKGSVTDTVDPVNGKPRHDLIWFDVDSSDYKQWQTEYAAWEKQYNTVKSDYDNSVNNNNMLLTNAEELEIKFYVNLFSTIAEKGWACNEQVSDTNYLSQMLLNGQYTLTTTERTKTEDESNPGDYIYTNKYKNEIATNCKKVCVVNDNDAKDEALVKYEHEKAIIAGKENEADCRMKNLETEQNAIKQMMEGIQKVMNDNMEKYLNVFT